MVEDNEVFLRILDAMIRRAQENIEKTGNLIPIYREGCLAYFAQRTI